MREAMVHRRLAALAAATGVAAAMVLGAAPAQAWPGDPTVMTYGDDGCDGDQLATIYALAPNGEWLSGNFGPWGGYALTFTRVPAHGESVRFDVFCGTTGYHSTHRWVNRPSVGTSLHVDL